MKNKITFGIIGCSSFARRTMLPAIKKTPNACLEMIGSRSITRAKKFAKEFSCKSYGNYEEVLENNKVDAVYISLPINLLDKWAVKAAKSGKNILCEKPATLSYRSASKLISECKKNDVRIMENFAFRFHPQHEKILRMINKEMVGKVFSFCSKFGFVLPYSSKNFRFQKKMGGGVLNDVGCYLVCACRLILQGVPSSIFCNLETDSKTGVDIKGSIQMTYPNGQIALGVFSYNNFFQSTYDIWGTKGLIRLKRAFNIKENMPGSIELSNESKIKKIKIKPTNQFKLMINGFCKELLHAGSTKFNFENDLLAQALVMDTARKSYSKKIPINIKKI